MSDVGFDGYLRLYDGNFQKIAKAKTVGGKEPFSLSFSPDGKEIALGYNDSTRVDIYDREGNYLYSPDTSGIEGGSLNSVSYSRSGILYGGEDIKPISSAILGLIDVLR
jgi:WD40 repeat protein